MSNPTTMRAAWLPSAKANPFKISSAAIPTPKPREILIRNRAIAINPCDSVIQSLGILHTNYPVIIGCDAAGEVVAVGSEASAVGGFKIGDRIIACMEWGAFAEYSVADMSLAAKLPGKIGFTEGVVLMTCLATATTAIFHEEEGMGLELPGLEVKKNGKVVVVWGVGSVVGSSAVQMLRASGYEVFGVASGKNEGYCRELGCKEVFDYRKEGVVERIIDGLKKAEDEFAGVFSAVLDKDALEGCARIAGEMGKDEKTKVVGTVLPCPPEQAPHLPKPENLPEGVKLGWCRFTMTILPFSPLAEMVGWPQGPKTDVGTKVINEWMTPALEKGLLRCKPDPEIVGKGLESVQKACDLMAQGVSAKKLVVEIP